MAVDGRTCWKEVLYIVGHLQAAMSPTSIISRLTCRNWLTNDVAGFRLTFEDLILRWEQGEFMTKTKT